MIKPNKVDVVATIIQILDDECSDPVEAMIAEVEALLKIAHALQGLEIADARATMRAVAELI